MALPVVAALAVVCAVVFAPAAQAQSKLQTINFEQVMQVDEVGNARVAITITLNAAQWTAWQQKYGQNKALLKRDMNKYMSQYETSDWDVSEKPMDRKLTITLTAKGTVVYKGDGRFEFKLPKDWKGGERNGTTFTYNYIEDIGGGVVGQFAVKLTLPKDAGSFKDEGTTDRGERVIQYVRPVSGSRGWVLWTGLFLIVAGGAAAGYARFAPGKP